MTAPDSQIDWENFEKALPGEVRSPCPMLNALSNHRILPHDGRDITVAMAVDALTRAVNLSPEVATTLATQAVKLNPDGKSQSFSLNMLATHGPIEHDCSLSRGDAAFGDNHSFQPEQWAKAMATYDGSKTTSIELQSKMRWERVRECEKQHKEASLPLEYGFKQWLLSYGESALILSLLGDPEHGKIPVEYVKTFFSEERLPYTEGWRKISQPVAQKDITRLILELFGANAHKGEELLLMGKDTVEAVYEEVAGAMPSCSTM